jgi:hypothetical protein
MDGVYFRFGVCLNPMSLAAASESRKERLIALRQRKLGQEAPNAEEG